MASCYLYSDIIPEEQSQNGDLHSNVVKICKKLRITVGQEREMTFGEENFSASQIKCENITFVVTFLSYVYFYL